MDIATEKDFSEKAFWAKSYGNFGSKTFENWYIYLEDICDGAE